MRLGEPVFVCDGNCLRCKYNPTTCPVKNPLAMPSGAEVDSGEGRAWTDSDYQDYRGEAA